MRPSDETGAASEDLRRLSAIVISLQRQAQTQGPESVVRVGDAGAKSVEAPILAPDATRSATHALALGRNGFSIFNLDWDALGRPRIWVCPRHILSSDFGPLARNIGSREHRSHCRTNNQS